MKTWQTTIKVAPIVSLARVNSPDWRRADRQMYASLDALRFMPNRTTAPLLVDHDPDCEIGTVTGLWRFQALDGPWICADATLHEPPEAWMKRGRGVSFGSKPYGRRAATFTGPEDQVVTAAFLEEVSVILALSPREPLAEVLSVRETEPVAIVGRDRSFTAQARASSAGRTAANPPAWLAKAQTEAAKKGHIVRASGRVLGVR
jgi:hypothetical protein